MAYGMRLLENAPASPSNYTYMHRLLIFQRLTNYLNKPF